MATQTMTQNAKCRELAAIWAELEQESKATQRVLEAVPENQLKWQPHPKGMTMGQLAIHIATIPQLVAVIVDPDRFDMTGVDFTPAQPTSKAEVIQAYHAALKQAKDVLSSRDSNWANAIWQMVKGGEVVWTLPRLPLLRMLILSHLYHHRGQLSTYLRATGQRVPSVYGPSADDNPFA